MPRVYCSEWKRICHRMVSWAQGEKKRLGVTDVELGEEYGISGSAMSRKFRLESMSFEDFTFLAHKFQPDTDTLRFIVGLK